MDKLRTDITEGSEDRAIINMMHSLNMQTIAEWVETADRLPLEERR